MPESDKRHRSTLATVILLLIIGEAITFFLAALLHLGLPLLPGFSQPRIIPATIVEGLCGLFLAVSIIALLTHRGGTRGIAIAAHIFAIVGVLVGIVSLALGTAPADEANTIYHRVILGVLIVVLILLLTPGARDALGRQHAAM